MIDGTGEAQAIAAVQKVGADYQTKAPELSHVIIARLYSPVDRWRSMRRWAMRLRKAKEVNLSLPLLASCYLVGECDRSHETSARLLFGEAGW